MRLCQLLGWRNVAWGLQQISGRELAEWEILLQGSEPLGDDRLDHLVAWLCAVLRTGMLPAGTRGYTDWDFWPPFLPHPRAERPLSEEELAAKVKRFFESRIAEQ